MVSASTTNYLEPIENEDKLIGKECPDNLRPQARQLASIMQNEINARGNWYKYKIEDFEIGSPLGRGKFGRVYLAREKKSEYMVALKTLFKSELKKYNMGGQLIREIEINVHLNHPHILSMFTFFDDEKRIYLVLEYAAFGDLFTLQQKQKNNCFPEPQSAKYIYQVASALEYCHTKSVMHRDIKPENLLLDIDDNIKLADFGWSVHAPSNKRRTMCGTLDYLPPEMILKMQYSSQVDNWCLGVLCFEFLTGKPPFESSNQETTYNKIKTLAIHYPSSLSAGGKDLIKSLLKIQPTHRMSLRDVIKHPWVTSQMILPYKKPSLD